MVYLLVAIGGFSLTCLPACSGGPRDEGRSVELSPGRLAPKACTITICPPPVSLRDVPGGDEYKDEFASILNAAGVLYAVAESCGTELLVASVGPDQVTTADYSSPIYVAKGTALADVCTMFGPLSAPTVGCQPSGCPNSNIIFDPNCPGGCGSGDEL